MKKPHRNQAPERDTMQERRIEPEDAAAFADQLRGAFESRDSSVSVALAGNPLALDRVSSTQFVVRHPGVPGHSRVFLGGETRPEGYPADLPYLPHEVVILGIDNAAVWWSRNDLVTLLAEVERQCAASGWSREPETPVPDPSVTRHTFGKGNAVRYVALGQGILRLAERIMRQRD
jgi:hypothetical protein